MYLTQNPLKLGYKLYSDIIFSSHLECIWLAVKFHIGHVLELQGRYKSAKEAYEQLLESPDLANVVKANALRQLGGCSNWESLADVLFSHFFYTTKFAKIKPQLTFFQ